MTLHPRAAKRLEYFNEAASAVAEGLTLAFSAHLERQVGVYPDYDALILLNNLYWKVVPEFRDNNHFPEGRLINPPKKAALTVLLIITSERPFFTSPDSTFDYTADMYCRLMLSIAVMQDFMELPDGEPSYEQKRDLLVTLCSYALIGHEKNAFNAVRYTLCIYMDALWRQFGAKLRDDIDEPLEVVEAD